MNPSASCSLDEVCARAQHLPSSPVILPQLLAALAHPDGTTEEIERLIQLDSALAAATLRLVNSAACRAGEPVASVHQAVLLLGFREIYKVASQTLLSRWELAHEAALPWAPGEYSRHTLCTALAAEVLAEATGRVDPRVAYTAGLVCDLGKLALAYACAESYPRIASVAAATGCTWPEAEHAVLGFGQAAAGARLLRAWRFPEAFARVAEFQLNPADAPAEVVLLAAHLHAARFLAVSLGPGVTEGGFLFALQGDFLTAQGFTPAGLDQAMLEVRERALSRLADRLTYGRLKA